MVVWPTMMLNFRTGRRRTDCAYLPVRRNSSHYSGSSFVPPSTVAHVAGKFRGHVLQLWGGGRLKWKRLLIRSIISSFFFTVVLVIMTPIFNPSYSKRPSHYSGSNPHNETVFIAANIIDESLISGAWGNAVLDLIDLIGPQNVFLRVYDNDSGPKVNAALQRFAKKVKCRSDALMSGALTNMTTKVKLLPQDSRVKRISYLAKVRNNAISPIAYASVSNATNVLHDVVSFDKLLFLNDVVFSPRDAADLLFATNMQSNGRTDYHAACAMDYINPMKFYDRFAMRDHEYYETGLPFFPWFVKGGHRAESYRDVMAQRDAVRVKSCWGGMVAFEAKWFHPDRVAKMKKGLQPLRFRSEPDAFWEASECCLIHADLEHLIRQAMGESAAINIFVNPYIRVAYDQTSFVWLEFTRRFERLFVVPHRIIAWVLGMPWSAGRRTEPLGRQVVRREWVYSEPKDSALVYSKTWNFDDISRFGSWRSVQRESSPGGYCGFPFLLALKDPRHLKPGERRWEKRFPPADLDA